MAELLWRRDFLRRTAALGTAAMAGSLLTGVAGQTVADAPANSSPWEIGCYTRPWAKYDYHTALDAIAEAGFKHVGLMTAKTQSHLVLSAADPLEWGVRVGKEAKDRGLEIASVYGGGLRMQNRGTAMADLRHLIDLCAVADARTLLMGGIGNPEHCDIYFGAIADCCDYAKEKGLGLTIKPHGGLNATGPQLRKVVEKVNHKNFSIWYDAGNVLHYSDGQLNPVDDAATIDGMVTGWCIKDYKHPKQVDVTPGTGQVDFPAVFAQLQNGGFTRGALIIETLAVGDLPQLLAEAKKARTFVETLVERQYVEYGLPVKIGE